MSETAGLKIFVGPANQLEMGTVATGPAAAVLTPVTPTKQRLDLTIPAPTADLVVAAQDAQAAATSAASAALSSQTAAANSANAAASSDSSAQAAATNAAAAVAVLLDGAVSDAEDAKVAAELAASLVEAPADTVTAGLVGNPETLTGRVLSAAIDAQVVEPIAEAIAPKLDKSEAAALYIPGKDYDAMRPFRAAVGDRSNSGCRIYVRGSSTAEGAMATSYDRTWQRILVNTLRQRYPARDGVTPDTGAGFWPPYYQMEPYPARSGSSIPADLPKFSTSGLAGKGQWIAVGSSRTFTFTGTHFDIWYNKINEASTLTYTVDGGAFVEVPIQSGAVQVAVAQSVTLTSGVHTVVISAKVGSFGPVPFLGFMSYNGSRTAGFHLWEGGYSGRITAQWVDNSVVNFERWTDAVALIQPNLVIDLPWLNDVVLTGGSPAIGKAHQQTIIDKINAKNTVDPTYLIVLGWLRKDVAEQNEPWAEYKKVAYELAAENPNVCVLDVGDMVGTPLDKSLSIWQDNVHLNDKGMGLLADLIADYLTAR